MNPSTCQQATNDSCARNEQVIKPAEYEQGVFWYFDWHLRNLEPSPGAAALKLPEVDGWCWRATKADFKFEYSLVRRERLPVTRDMMHGIGVFCTPYCMAWRSDLRHLPTDYVRDLIPAITLKPQ